MPNPFFYGGRITNPANFIGRTKELQTIFSALEIAHSGQLQHVQVVGPRRIGKSSLLYHITQVYQRRLMQPEKYRFVYVDLDDARCHTLEGLLKYILSQLGISSKPTFAKFQEAIEGLNRSQGIYPVLCLDEFEFLLKRREEFTNEFYEVWRSLGSSSQLAFVTASKVSLGELIRQGNFTSSFHNIFTYLELGNFTESEARALLAHNIDRPFVDSEINKLFKLAGYHPSQLQLAARLLYEAKENPTIDWDTLKKQHQKLLKHIKPISPRTEKWEWVQKLKILFLNFPNMLGRFVWDLAGRHDAKDSSATFLGWILVAVGLALLFGILKTNAVVEFFKYNWRFFFPEK